MASYVPVNAAFNSTLTVNVNTVSPNTTGDNGTMRQGAGLNCTWDLPPASRLLGGVLAWNDPDIALFVICAISAMISLPLSIDALWYVIRNYTNHQRKIQTVWMVGIYPVFSITSFLSVMIPRGATTCDFVGSIYFALAEYQFTSLLLNYIGGEEEACKRLGAKEDSMKAMTGPCCCCCCCLPRVRFTKRNLFRIKVLVLQSPLLHVAVLFLATLLWNDGSHLPGGIGFRNAQFWFSSIVGGSKIVALYGVNIILTGVRVPLDGYQPMGKFAVFPILLCCTRLQSFIINMVAMTGGIACKPPLSPAGRAIVIHNSVLALEIFLLAIWGRWLYKRPLPGTVEKYSSLDEINENSKMKNVNTEVEDLDKIYVA